MNGVNKYRKRTVVVKAIQWTGENDDDVRAFTASDTPIGTIFEGDMTPDDLSGFEPFTAPSGRSLARLWVRANHCWVLIDPGSWVIRDASGFYPCLPERFAESYELNR